MSLFTEIDFWFFNKLNGELAPFVTLVMKWASAKYTWIPLYALVLVLVIKKFRFKAWIVVVFYVANVFLSDQSSVLIKKTIKRPRPCHYPQEKFEVFTAGKCGGLYGFVSSHASNSAAFALLTFLLLRKKSIGWVVAIYALLVGYSRIYLGVHFPFDVLFGYLNGMICGGLVYYFLQVTSKKYVQLNL